ncbi:hypothetical protein BS78_02G015000 [Paspalum vaginatum]|nr:hypothetical protein BS78_02G015000 [Paspalum vaginatum]
MACQQVIKVSSSNPTTTPLPPVLWLRSTLLTIICSLLCSHAKQCSCSSSNSSHPQDLQTASYTWNTTFQQMNQGLLFRRDGGDDGEVTLQPGSLGYYMGNTSLLNSSDSGWFVIPARWFDGPWKQQTTRGGGEPLIGDLNQASFTIVFTLMSSSSSNNTTASSPLLFDILPRLEPSPVSTDNGRTCPPILGRCQFVPGPGPGPAPPPVQIETLNTTNFDSGTTVRVTIDLPSSLPTSVRIDYDHGAHNLSVYLAGPDDAAAGTHQVPVPLVTKHLNHTDALAPDALVFAITATMGQLLHLDTWNFTVEVPVAQDSQRGNDTLTILLASVLGSAAAVYAYFNSKYRRWKKDLDQLAKSMQRLPGVPMKVEFADIKKATANFHETTRLGQGGFGAVYRCRLPAPSDKGGFVEVAVKKFTRPPTTAATKTSWRRSASSTAYATRILFHLLDGLTTEESPS